jgi:hypothetical protein
MSASPYQKGAGADCDAAKGASGSSAAHPIDAATNARRSAIMNVDSTAHEAPHLFAYLIDLHLQYRHPLQLYIQLPIDILDLVLDDGQYFQSIGRQGGSS